jgi:hypothetical protein
MTKQSSRDKHHLTREDCLKIIALGHVLASNGDARRGALAKEVGVDAASAAALARELWRAIEIINAAD